MLNRRELLQLVGAASAASVVDPATGLISPEGSAVLKVPMPAEETQVYAGLMFVSRYKVTKSVPAMVFCPLVTPDTYELEDSHFELALDLAEPLPIRRYGRGHINLQFKYDSPKFVEMLERMENSSINMQALMDGSPASRWGSILYGYVSRGPNDNTTWWLGPVAYNVAITDLVSSLKNEGRLSYTFGRTCFQCSDNVPDSQVANSKLVVDVLQEVYKPELRFQELLPSWPLSS